MKKSSKSSLKERSLDISLQHKNQPTYTFSKKKLLHLAKNRAGAERVKMFLCSIKSKVAVKSPKKLKKKNNFSAENQLGAERVNK